MVMSGNRYISLAKAADRKNWELLAKEEDFDLTPEEDLEDWDYLDEPAFGD